MSSGPVQEPRRLGVQGVKTQFQVNLSSPARRPANYGEVRLSVRSIVFGPTVSFRAWRARVVQEGFAGAQQGMQPARGEG